jgi:hypothetical protein
MDPQVLGQVAGRSVRAPADTKAWVREIMADLKQLGVMVQFGADSPAKPSAIDARAELKTAWVSSVTTAKTASVVLSMQYLRGGALLKAADYRGSISRANWNSGDAEIQRMVDSAFTEVLTQVTADLRTLCQHAVLN